MRKPSLRKAAAILFIVVLLAGLAACGGDQDPDGRIVKINDEAITNGQFENFCTLWLYTQGFDPSEPLTSDQKSLALGDMINAEALRQYYEKEDPSVFSNSYQSSLDTFLNQMKTGNAEFLSSHDISDEDIEFYYMSQYLTETCFDKIRSEQEEDVLAEEAKKYYDEHEAEFRGETFDESLEEIYYLLYSEMYDQKLKEIKDDMTIEK